MAKEEARDAFGGASGDVYLQPHFDDICFSLGALVHERHTGVLLTIFSDCSYVASRPGVATPPPEIVTATRKAEDETFAAACTRLRRNLWGVPEASRRGHGSRDLSHIEENVTRIGAQLLEILRRHAAGSTSG